MNVDNALISKLEKLARLQLDPQEKKGLQKDLSNILGMIEKLNELDTTGVEPLIHLSEEVNGLRADKVENQLSRSKALANAPKTDGVYFLVPKVIEQKEKKK